MKLQQEEVKAYFARNGTVSQWWDPEGVRNKYHFEKEMQILQSQLKIDPTWRVLDVGCGQGRYTIWFAQKGCQVTAVDLSQEMLNLCRQNAEAARVSDSIDLVLADAEHLSQLEDGQYDVVSCMATFVHIPDLEKATINMARKLRPGGHFLFTFASADSLHGRLAKAYFSNPWLRKLLGGGDGISQVARPLVLEDTIRILERARLSHIKVFGIGLLFLFVRPEFRGKAMVRFLRCLSMTEERLKPYYTSRRMARLSATILGIGTRVENGDTSHGKKGG